MSMKLELRFATEDGKNRVISIEQPKLNLDAETVQTVMEEIVAQDMFTVEGDRQFSTIRGARYVTRTVDDILINE